MKISIIIPMYNSQNYIDRAIESIIINQSYTDYEIILIDDCSKDNTIACCNKYLKDNIKLFKSEINSGVSNARNIGIENATGDYIVFLDSDDWLDKESLNIINENAKDNDLIIFGTTYSRSNGLFKQPLPFVGNILKKNLFSDIFLLLDISIAHWVTNKVFKTSIIKENNLKFNTNIKMGEDLDFTLNYLEKINKIVVLDKYLYFYDRTNERSLTNSNILSLPERTKFNNDNIEKFLTKNYVDLTNFKIYKKNLYDYVETKINKSSYSEEIKELLHNKNKSLNSD